MVATDDAKSVLSVLFAYVKSWFQTVESKSEFELSYSSFRQTLFDNRKCLGEHTCINVEKLVSNLISKEKYLFHYNFVNHTTLGFTGDSIVEASFSALKRSCITVNSKKTIEYSGMGIVAQSDEKVVREQREQGSMVDRDVLWSRCQVKDVLTKYALGLFCKNFDRRTEYIFSNNGKNKWLVGHKSIFEKHSEKRSMLPNFTRIRQVCLTEESFLTCSCGRTTQYLLPCVHICTVVDDESHFGPYQFHVRWHKDFAYLHNTDYDWCLLVWWLCLILKGTQFHC